MVPQRAGHCQTHSVRWSLPQGASSWHRQGRQETVSHIGKLRQESGGNEPRAPAQGRQEMEWGPCSVGQGQNPGQVPQGICLIWISRVLSLSGNHLAERWVCRAVWVFGLSWVAEPGLAPDLSLCLFFSSPLSGFRSASAAPACDSEPRPGTPPIPSRQAPGLYLGPGHGVSLCSSFVPRW